MTNRDQPQCLKIMHENSPSTLLNTQLGDITHFFGVVVKIQPIPTSTSLFFGPSVADSGARAPAVIDQKGRMAADNVLAMSTMKTVTREEEEEDKPRSKRTNLQTIVDVDVLLGQILEYLTPCDIISSCALAAKWTKERFVLSNMATSFWKRRLKLDFSYTDSQSNRSPGFYKKLYLDLLEERLETDNLVAGGH